MKKCGLITGLTFPSPGWDLPVHTDLMEIASTLFVEVSMLLPLSGMLYFVTSLTLLPSHPVRTSSNNGVDIKSFPIPLLEAISPAEFPQNLICTFLHFIFCIILRVPFLLEFSVISGRMGAYFTLI